MSTSSRQDLIQTIVDVTGSDVASATRCLELSNWDVNDAINLFLTDSWKDVQAFAAQQPNASSGAQASSSAFSNSGKAAKRGKGKGKGKARSSSTRRRDDANDMDAATAAAIAAR